MAFFSNFGACDGLSETVKRLAAQASLQRPYYDQLMTPSQLFDWACTSIPAGIVAVKIMQGSRVVYLEQRFQLSRTIPGTRKLHSFVPISNSALEVRPYSARLRYFLNFSEMASGTTEPHAHTTTPKSYLW